MICWAMFDLTEAAPEKQQNRGSRGVVIQVQVQGRIVIGNNKLVIFCMSHSY